MVIGLHDGEKIVFWCMSRLKQKSLCFKVWKIVIDMHEMMIDEYCMVINWIWGVGMFESVLLHE